MGSGRGNFCAEGNVCYFALSSGYKAYYTIYLKYEWKINNIQKPNNAEIIRKLKINGIHYSEFHK